MKKIIVLFCFFFLLQIGVAHSQKIKPDDSFTLELGLPNAFVNKPFKTIMQGLVSISPYYQYTLKNGLSFGTGLHYTYFAVNEFRVPSKVYGGMHTGAVFIKVGHEKFWTERFGTDIGIKTGYAQSIITTDALKDKGISYNQIESVYVEPVLGLVVASDVNASYRLSIGYAFYGFSYKPWLIGVDSQLGYDPAEFNKKSSFLTVGFAYTHYFNGKKSEAGNFDD